MLFNLASKLNEMHDPEKRGKAIARQNKKAARNAKNQDVNIAPVFGQEEPEAQNLLNA